MIRIAKTFRWEMGHRLPDHPGGCRNLHGHSYRLTVEIGGLPAANGMIIDFDEISAVVKPLLDTLDHAFLVEERDRDLIEYLRDHDHKHVIVPFPSTVENICRYLGDRIRPALQGHGNVAELTIRVHETETCSAVITEACS